MEESREAWKRKGEVCLFLVNNHSRCIYSVDALGLYVILKVIILQIYYRMEEITPAEG